MWTSIFIGIFLSQLKTVHPESDLIETNNGTITADNNNNQKERDLEFILNNVKNVYLNGWPAVMSVYGPTAFPILVGQTGSGIYVPIAAASQFGKGKFMGLATDDFLDPETKQKSNKNEFLLNSIKWVSRSKSYNVALINTTYKSTNPISTFLSNNSMATTVISGKELASAETLSKYDVILVQEFFNSSLVPILVEFAENGGGLIVALTAWAHYYFLKVSGRFGDNFPPNMISSRVGFIWHDDGIYDLTSRIYNATTENLKSIKVDEAWEEIKQEIVSGYPDETQSKLQQYSTILNYGFEGIPRNDSFWSSIFYEDAQNFTQIIDQPVPSLKHPVTSNINKFELQLFNGLATAILKPEDVPAHPASLIFPGDVKETRSQNLDDYAEVTITYQKPSWFTEFTRSSKDPWNYVPNYENTCHQERAGRGGSSRNLRESTAEENTVSNEHPLWFSTGLYARPGQVIQATLKSKLVMDAYSIQIGSHIDDISSFPEWFRSPRITSKSDFVNNTATINCPYGGLIYIVVPEKKISEDEKTIVVSMVGSVRTPFFKLGVTRKREWKNRIRHEPGPWAEFETNNIILTVPSASIRELEDPEGLLVFWDQVMDAIADLAAIPRERYRQERIVPDAQISIGFMHAGYPIMTLLNEGNDAVNISLLRSKGSWGHFHELGHNHQIDDWTFDGTVEVTCNLFALYVMNNVVGIPTEETRAELTPKVYKALVLEYIVGGLDFEKWKSEPFLALMFYVQLQRAYGWTAYKQVFARYRELTEHPQSEQEKIDMWLVIFSATVKENLYSFFQSWGFPISEEASELVSEYPDSSLSITDLLSDACNA